ncbi:hypothetical protein PRIPAC_91717 [Pristionchus pacificus]|nr:hypothetical protein PRIPAC_91717 [Pristionchus pacificus]
MPPSGAKWCPLCAVAVNDNKEDWIQHTKSDRGCYNNPRNSKIPDNAKTSLVPDQLFLTTRPKSTAPGGNPGSGPGSGYGPAGDPGSQTYKVPDAVYHGPQHDMRGRRLIDADQLLSALKVANQKKKAQRKKKQEETDREAETTRTE